MDSNLLGELEHVVCAKLRQTIRVDLPCQPFVDGGGLLFKGCFHFGLGLGIRSMPPQLVQEPFLMRTGKSAPSPSPRSDMFSVLHNHDCVVHTQQ